MHILVCSLKACYTACMDVLLTAKLKLHTTPEQFRALRQTQLAYRAALNPGSQYAFAQGKLSNQIALCERTYRDVRARFGLPAQMATNVPRQVGATYKGLWTKVKANAAARAAGKTRKRYRGLDQAPKYVSPTLASDYQRDHSFKTGQQVSVLTLQGRVIVPYTGYSPHVAHIGQGTQKGGHLGAAKLWYDQPHKQCYPLVSLQIAGPDPVPERQRHIVGVDLGQRYLAVATDTLNRTHFFPGREARTKADHYARLRKRVQHKGTRSATRLLTVLAGRERRLKHDRNHVISRRSVDASPHSLSGLEDLTHIRERTKRKRRHGKQAAIKQRRANRHASQWTFAELQGYVASKALLAGSMAVKVDAYTTSQACPRCGYTAEDNRPGKGLVFSCQVCQLALHADLIGARNVALRTLLARQDWVRTGVLSQRPDVSDAEAKAVQRRRYAELRWSPDTSPRPLGGGI
jgi:putative transposase